MYAALSTSNFERTSVMTFELLVHSVGHWLEIGEKLCYYKTTTLNFTQFEKHHDISGL